MKLSVRDFEITMIPILMSLMEKDGNMVKNREFHHSNGKYKIMFDWFGVQMIQTRNWNFKHLVFKF